MILIKMQKSFLVIFEVFLRLNSDLLDMISCFVTAVSEDEVLKPCHSNHFCCLGKSFKGVFFYVIVFHANLVT